MTATTLLLTVPEAATHLRLERNAVYKRIASGELKAVDIAPEGSTKTILRISLADLQAYIDGLPRAIA